ncbi:hypothetical protein AVEN_25612-1 [Araneus ventricosus]|uniref:Uncharacterized protein n=1 Tax=Araneus ventricosus TaxID=182803 RepID=A0A4Y2BN03_ARAVE|nr:hypothetical protein AVEN_25612-1 [Araneus ventricosus]
MSSLTCTRPTCMQIFGGIGSENLWSRSRDFTTRPPLPWWKSRIFIQDSGIKFFSRSDPTHEARPVNICSLSNSFILIKNGRLECRVKAPSLYRGD